VFTPFTQAHPAKFIATFFASDMVAALVLFNRESTVWVLTGLGVCYDPVDVFTLTGVLDIPFLVHFARSRSVQLVGTLEAEGITTDAINDVSKSQVSSSLNCVLAFLAVGTPFNIFIVVSE